MDGLLQERECSRSNSGFIILLEKNCVKWLSLGLTGVLLVSFLCFYCIRQEAG